MGYRSFSWPYGDEDGKVYPDHLFGGIAPNGDLISSYCEIYNGERGSVRLGKMFLRRYILRSFDVPVECPQQGQPKVEQEK